MANPTLVRADATRLRPTTNLIIPPGLTLPRKELKQNFMYVYTGAYTGTGSSFMTRLWASSFFPSITNSPKFGKLRPRAVADGLAKELPENFLRLKKVDTPNDPHFVVSVPLYQFASHSSERTLRFLMDLFMGQRWSKTLIENTAEQLNEVKEWNQQAADTPKDQLTERTLPASHVINNMHLDAVGSEALRQCLLQVRIQSKGLYNVVFADFKIRKEEAQQLTTTEWSMLRAIDLYPLLLHWVRTTFGDRGQAPVASFPVSKIAFSLPPSHVESARVNDLGISVGPDGKPYFLPRSVDKNQTILYEDRYTGAGTRGDGSFALLDTEQGAEAMSSGHEPKTKLPHNMVVAVDWLNNKYSYTNTEGMLSVMDLTRFQPANVAHIHELLHSRSINEKHVSWFVSLGEAAGVPLTAFETLPSDLEDVQSETMKQTLSRTAGPLLWFKSARQSYAQDINDLVPFASISVNGYSAMRPLARYFKLIEAAVRANIEPVYLKYSVMTVAEMFSWLVLITHYTDDMPRLKADDAAYRHAALNQGVDPDYEVPSIPLMASNMGFLPHQKKVRNLLKDSPDFAIMPVQTGGGKSVLLLTDLLLEFKANRNAPYLVLCPSHLVPNYVKEAVYFTGGKLNVIAITNPAIRQNGWKRLQAIMMAAPRNTVVVVALDTLKFRPRTVSYGTTPVDVFPVIDFLRQFKFGYVAIDEAHRIKGATARNKSVMALVADIPKKRLASGTFVHDSPSDLAMTIAALDPTLFGTRDEFNDRYGLEVRGGRVIKWRPNAQREIMQKIRSRVVIAGAMRKEWAAFLPKKVEWVGGVNLTPAQQAVYEDLLNKVIEQIEQDAKTNKALQDFVKGRHTKDNVRDDEADVEAEDEVEDERDDVDEDAGEDLSAMLNPYLARLEQFLVAPGSDPLGAALLKGEDLLSPKVALIYQRIRLHLEGGEADGKPYGPFPGKVIVFCNQVAAAEEIFNSAPPDLKKSGLLYKASEKVEILSQLENNPNKKWVVGVGQSMEEGLNLQFASRIIRASTVWNPGNLEQSNARIERPEFKKAETRPQIFFDTIVANRTFDISKTARLIAKVIAAAKFENADSHLYDEIPDVPVIPMTLDTIRTMNTWERVSDTNPGLVEYMKALQVYQEVRNKDYDQYKEDYIKKYGEGPVMSPIEVAPTPPDSKLLKYTPYVPGLGLYNEKELGLVRLDEAMNVVTTDEEEEEDEKEVPEGYVDPAIVQRVNELNGSLAHTEWGDGYIRGLRPGAKMVTVELLNGYRVRVQRSQVFVVGRTLTSNKDIRNQILKAIGDLPVSTPAEVPADRWIPSTKALEIQKKQADKLRQKEEKQEQKEKESALNIELTLFVANGFLGIDYLLDDENHMATRVLQAAGFRTTPEYYYSKVVNAKALENQFALWAEKGLQIDPIVLKQGVGDAFNEMLRLLKAGLVRNHTETYKATRQAQVVNFYRLEHRPSNKKDMFKPYPIIQDGVAYIALPATGQAATRLAMQYKRPSYKWIKSEPTLSYFGSFQQVVSMLQKLEAQGMHISNKRELNKELSRLKLMKVRKVEDDNALV